MLPYITQRAPRLQIVMGWGDAPPEGEVFLYIRRMGEPTEFAVYSPIETLASKLTFQFDDLLFVLKYGRFEGRLVKGVTNIATIEFEYKDSLAIIKVENPNV